MSMALREDDWDRHWDRYAQSAARNPAQRLRRGVIRSLLGLDDGPARILDIGSGQGDLLAELRAEFPRAELAGVDSSQSGVEIAHGKVPGAIFLRRDLLQGDEPPNELRRWATHAICSEVLEHVDDPRALLKNASAYLAPGCRLVVTVPAGPMSAFDRHIGHRTHFTRNHLRDLLVSAGFEPLRVAGVGFPFFNLYRLVVMLRGERLVRDVAGGDRAAATALARFTMEAFRLLFGLNIPSSPWGWQIVALARLIKTPVDSSA